MTVLPPSYIDGVSYDGAAFRLNQGALMQPGSSALSIRSGVRQSSSPSLKISQDSTPSMSVVVSAGQCLIQGTEEITQSGYVVTNDAPLSIPIGAASGGAARIDTIVVRVYDFVVEGDPESTSYADIYAVPGDPASTPTPPAVLPANTLKLADVRINASASTVVDANITDRRVFTSALGGTITCTSTLRPSPSYEGMMAYELDTDRVIVQTSPLGNAWRVVSQGNHVLPQSVLSTARPTGVVTGQMIYETDVHRLSAFDGANWQQVWRRNSAQEDFETATLTTTAKVWTTLTNGPVLDVWVPQSGVVLFMVGATSYTNGASYTASVGFKSSGAHTFAADYNQSARVTGVNRASVMRAVINRFMHPGKCTITAQFYTTGGTATFEETWLQAIPLG